MSARQAGELGGEAPLPAPFMRPLLFGVFARALPLTMFGPLLPGIAASLGARLVDVGWIVATYATGSLIAQPLMGTLSDAHGRRRMFTWCMALFVVGSGTCAVATTLPLLVAGRVVQALGAGGIAPIATAIIGGALPAERRGAALGSMYGVFGLGTMAGALLGGTLVAAATTVAAHGGGPVLADLRAFPWHSVFAVNVVTGLVTIVLARSLPDDVRLPRASKPAAFDVWGAVLIVALAASLMFAVTGGRREALLGLSVAVASIVLFIWRERHAAQPLIDPTLFASRGPALLFAIALLFGVPGFSLTIYSATYYIAQFGASAAEAGLALFGLAMLYVAGAVAGGAFINRFGARNLLATGAAIVAVATGLLAALSSPVAVTAAMALGGLGLGIASAPPNALILRYVPSMRAGAATGVATMLGTSGSITAPAAVGAFLAAHSAANAAPALRAEFALCAALAAVCALIAATLPRPVVVAP